MKQNEALEQSALLQWTAYNSGKYPELELLFHIPNGGSRNKMEAYNLKKQGVKAGVPDLFLPVARGKYHGLFIEMKAGKNTTTEKQNKWIDELRKQNYKVEVCYSCEIAIMVLENYLKNCVLQSTEKRKGELL